jgi:hypothetical protein
MRFKKENTTAKELPSPSYSTHSGFTRRILGVAFKDALEKCGG